MAGGPSPVTEKRHEKKVGLTVFLLLTLPRAGFAEAPVGSGPPPPASPAARAPAYGASAIPSAVPPPPHVDDPMLVPVPPPKRGVSSWAEALQLLLGRSSNLKMAIDQVINAEGQTMIALAQVLH